VSKKNVGKDADVAAWKAALQGEIHFRLAEGVIRGLLRRPGIPGANLIGHG
jgi:hypothetical protein